MPYPQIDRLVPAIGGDQPALAAGGSGRGLRRVAAGAGLVAGCAIGFAPWLMAYLSTHPVRLPLAKTPADDGLDYEDVRFDARDGVPLSGWFVPADDPRGLIILSHGHPFNRCEMMGWMRRLHPAGFHVFLYDFRSMGRSGGDLCTLGHTESADLLGALDYLSRRGDCAGLPVGALGISLGGAVSIFAASEDERIRAVVTHGAFATLGRAITQRGRMFLGPFGPILSVPARHIGRRWLSVDPEGIAPVRSIGAIAPRPVLLYHGARDRIVHPSDAYLLYEAAGAPKICRILDRSGHVFVHPSERDRQASEVLSFFESALIGGSLSS